MVHKISPIPHSGRKEESGEVKEETVPIPHEFERIEHVVEDSEWRKGLI